MIDAPGRAPTAQPLDPLTAFAVGVDHHAPIALRERLAAAGPALLERLAERVDEIALLSTCNRTEIYLVGLQSDASPLPLGEGQGEGVAAVARDLRSQAATHVVATVAAVAGLPERELAEWLWVRQGAAAAAHLFGVAAGLESQLLGETEILRQVRVANAAAQERRGRGPVLAALFGHALAVGKRARAQTDISRGAASIGSAAAAIVRDELPRANRCHAVLVGAGDAASRILTHLRPLDFARIDVVNRTVTRAAELLGHTKVGRAFGLDALPQLLAEADVVLCATSSASAVVTLTDAAAALRQRAGRPLLLLDLAVPRDVEPAVGDIPTITLHDLDAVQARAVADVERRASAATHARGLVHAEVAAFERWLTARRAAPAIAQLRDNAERQRRRQHPPDDRASRLLMRRLLHAPTIALRRSERPDLSGLCAAGFVEMHGAAKPSLSA